MFSDPLPLGVMSIRAAQPCRQIRAVWLAVCCLLLVVPALAQPEPGQAEPADGAPFLVSSFEVEHLYPHPNLPTPERLASQPIRLGVVEHGFVAPRDGIPHTTITLNEVEHWPTGDFFYASALQSIFEQLRDVLMEQQLMAVSVAPDPMQIDQYGEDRREDNDLTFTILVSVGRNTELRTLTGGERWSNEQLENRPEHDRIVRNSPIRPAADPDAEADRQDLLHERELDEYALRLSRHPGRRVDAILAPAEDVGGVALGYMVTEAKPWAVYAQTSNTGTRQTREWRQQFGFFHNQLTDNDDILSLQYLTAGFEDVHAVSASYEAPVGYLDRLRWRVDGTFSDYTASDVGLFLDRFDGTSWSVGGELAANVFQHRNLFVDVFGGARYLDVKVTSTVPGLERGREQFVLPRLGVRMERPGQWYHTHALAQFEGQAGDITNVDQAEIDRLGRPFVDRDWLVLQWRLGHSFYLDPLVRGEAWRDRGTPETSTLAHELSFDIHGQYAFDNRLIPQMQQVAGGLYTVRGYPESVAAGDDVYIGRAEYRFHLPRMFTLEQEPRELFGQPFRFAPQYVYGPTDWDLTLRTFLDVGHVRRNAASGFPGERSDTLLGTGLGVDLAFRRNVRASIDWGIALRDAAGSEVTSGSNRFHFAFTLLY